MVACDCWSISLWLMKDLSLLPFSSRHDYPLTPAPSFINSSQALRKAVTSVSS